MNFFTPIFRSRRFGHRQLTARVVILVGLFTWLAPALLGLMLVILFSAVMPTHDFDSPLAVIVGAGALLIFAPVYGVVLVPLGLLVGAWAMRFGIAGWGMAALVSVALPLGIGALVQWADATSAALGALIVLTPPVFFHAFAMWCATRYLCPDALFDRLP